MTLKQYLRELKANILGIAVLGVGVLAVLIVGVLAYRSLSFSADGQGAQISREEINAFKEAEPIFEEEQAAEEKPKPTYKRQKSISERQIVGSWDTQIKGGRALLQLQGGTYRLIIVMDNPAASRWYSNGTYTLQDDLLVLSPNMKWGPPKSKRFGYRVLTRSNMPVMVSKNRGNLVWQVPGPDADIYVPNYHPMLNLTEDKIAVWDVLK